MIYQNLGNSECKISRLGLGTMSLDNEAQGISIIHQALDNGINYLDTADLYGRGASETMIGHALKENGTRWCWQPRWEINGQKARKDGAGIPTNPIF
jgi:aryl-alcohol dehydrogenase-like predicted oxidoreductase